MVIDFRAGNTKAKLQQIFLEVISQQTWLHCCLLRLNSKKLSLTDVIRGYSKRSKAAVCHLAAVIKVPRCDIRFRGLKATNTLPWMYLKVRNKK